MTIQQVEALPIGAELRIKTGKLETPCFLAGKNRDGHGRVWVSTRPNAGNRWRVKPAQLRPVLGDQQ